MTASWIIAPAPAPLEPVYRYRNGRTVRYGSLWSHPSTEYKIVNEAGTSYYEVAVDGYRITGGLSLEAAARNALEHIERDVTLRGLEKSTADPTMGERNCRTHGLAPVAYLNDGRYGCILCNPYRKPFRGLGPSAYQAPETPAPVGDIPDWMC